MRLAYADPPYPGQAKRHYGTHPDYAGEVDHAELIERLNTYDGWALSTSMRALRDVLALCPSSVVIAAWVVTDAQPPGAAPWKHWYAWEPVIVSPARARPDVKNVLACSFHAGRYETGRSADEVTGMKPAPFCVWVFALIGAEPGDDLCDLFPGSGSVAREWDRFTRQPSLS